MSEQFSEFTLNFNSGARANDKAPTMRGKAKVIADGAASEFDVAAWGPNTAQTGGPDFYNVTMTPKDPASSMGLRMAATVTPAPEATWWASIWRGSMR